MYRKSSVSWTKHADFIFLDLLFLQIAFIFSYYLREGSFNVYQSDLYRSMAMVIAMVHICVGIFMESYSDVVRRGWMVEFFAVIKHVVFVVAGELFFLFFAKSGHEFSRLNVAYFTMISIVLLYVYRCIWKVILRKRLLQKKDERILLLVADEKRASEILQTMNSRLILDRSVCGIILLDGAGTKKKIQDIPVIGNLKAADDYLGKNVVDEVLFAKSPGTEYPKDLIKKCETMGLTIHIEIAESEYLPIAATLEKISGIKVLSSSIKVVTTRQVLLKRGMDILGSIVGLILTGIISIVLVPAILISDPGPIIFAQKRIGKNGRPFLMYKFRSMYQDAEARKKEYMDQNQLSGPMFKLKADPRIIGSGKDGTKHGLGWFIRTTSLDEFPQFWNVLKGDMSLVGTRPPTVDEWEQYELKHRVRLATKPGITGLWQISGRSDIVDFDEVVRLDTEYIRNWSPSLDLKILVKTLLVVVLRKGSR